MADTLLSRYGTRIDELVLVPSSGGRFEISRDDQLLFSKAALGRHAEIEEIVSAVDERSPVRA